MPVQALLLDFDGVLADTENYHIAAWEQVFARMGWEVPAEVCARSAEQDDRVFLNELFASQAITGGDVEGYVRRKQEIVRSMLADYPRLYPGARELVLAARKVARLGIVSTSWRENIAIVLDRNGLKSLFETIVAKEDVKHAKPDPEPYRLAIKRMGLKGKECLAIEDSPSGLQSARAAGLLVAAVGHRRQRGDWHADAPFLPDLRDLASVLRLMGWA